MKQIAFESVLEHSFRQRDKQINQFIRKNREKYIASAKAIEPDLQDSCAVWSRLVFAILSANSPFEDTVKALGYCIERFDKELPVLAEDIIKYKMVPMKADYINALPRAYLGGYLIRADETWQDYRLRLKEIKGLGLAKASFAASLLYPLRADLACVDTWIQKVFLGHTGFKQLSLKTYLKVEAKIRSYAIAHGINTFLAQWLIWDHARGFITNHAVFPGVHKTDAAPF